MTPSRGARSRPSPPSPTSLRSRRRRTPRTSAPASRQRRTGRPPPSGAGDARGARLDRAATARLLALARARGGTLFTVLLAGFQLLLERTTGDPEVWIGAPAVDRAAARWLRTVGYFANTVVLRS